MRRIKQARRHRRFLIHFLAECKECCWNTQDFCKGQRQASEHARRTGHEIQGEEGYAIRYNEEKP